MNLRKPLAPQNATTAEAVRYLASVCDGAILRDGHGFSTDHVPIGHHLAQLPEADWDAWHHAHARHLTHAYRRQLSQAGFDPNHILSGRRPRRTSRRKYRRLTGAWHPDPTAIWAQRWWNGQRWTHHVLAHANQPPIGISAPFTSQGAA